MNQELISQTYESITNPILRLMIWMLVAAVMALSGAVVFLFRKYVALNEENIAVLRDISNGLENLQNAQRT